VRIVKWLQQPAIIRFLDTRTFATCSDDTTVALWDVRKGGHPTGTYQYPRNTKKCFWKTSPYLFLLIQIRNFCVLEWRHRFILVDSDPIFFSETASPYSFWLILIRNIFVLEWRHRLILVDSDPKFFRNRFSVFILVVSDLQYLSVIASPDLFFVDLDPQ